MLFRLLILFKSGKHPSQRVDATRSTGSNTPSRLFYVTDHITGTHFLDDTGADVRLIPPSRSAKQQISSLTLQAVNRSSIATYGEKLLTLDIGHCSILFKSGNIQARD